MGPKEILGTSKQQKKIKNKKVTKKETKKCDWGPFVKLEDDFK